MKWSEIAANTVLFGAALVLMEVLDRKRAARLEARMTLRAADMIERHEGQGAAEPVPDPA